MVALVQPSPFMFTRQLAGNGDDLDYQDIPQSHYSAPPMTSYEASIAADHLQYPRQFGAAPYGFDNETWLNASNMYEGRPSPPANAYDDANLSSMSAPSPTSSAGSPPSQPGQLAGGSPAEWPAAGNMVLTPGIAGHGGEYIAGSDFSGYSGAMEEFPIDFTAVQPKAPSFVGESAQVSTSSAAVATTAPTTGAIMSPVVATDVSCAPSTVVFPVAAPAADLSNLSSSVLAGSKRRHQSSGSVGSHNPPQTPLLSPYFAQGSNGYFAAPAHSPCRFLLSRLFWGFPTCRAPVLTAANLQTRLRSSTRRCTRPARWACHHSSTLPTATRSPRRSRPFPKTAPS